MANKYYDNSDAGQRFQPGTTARSDEVDGKFDQVATGMEMVEQDTNRALKFPSEEGVSQEFTATALERRRKVLGFDDAGNLVLTGGFSYRGDWAPSTDYLRNDVFRYAVNKNLYVVDTDFTSGLTFATTNLSLAINVADVEAAKTAAELARDLGQTAQAGAETARTGAETALSSTEAARDITTAARDTTTTARDTTLDARDLVLATYDNFDDRYLGPKASAPTLDNDGDPLITGALYFDTSTNAMQVYTGTEWINASSVVEGVRATFEYDAAAGQTSFSGADRNGNVLAFDTASSLNVYRNGARLARVHFTADNVTNTVVVPSATEDDIIEIEAFGNFKETALDTLDARYAPITRSRKNLLINGGFDVFQRGESFLGLTAAQYTADRWSTWDGDGTGSVDVTKEDLLLSDGRTVPALQLTTANAAGGTTFGLFINQIVENPNPVSGRSVTISGWVDSSVTTTLNWRTVTKVNGVDSNIDVASINLTAGLNRIEITKTIPLLALATGADDGLTSQLYIPPNVNATLKYAELQLELGDTATDFEQRSIGEELALCQRYYQKGEFAETLPISNSSVIGSFITAVTFVNEMRATPSVTGVSNQGTFSAVSASPTNVSVGRSDTLANRVNSGSYTADAEL